MREIVVVCCGKIGIDAGSEKAGHFPVESMPSEIEQYARMTKERYYFSCTCIQL